MEINEKLIDLEEAIELMGGTVLSFKTRVEDIEVEKDKWFWRPFNYIFR